MFRNLVIFIKTVERVDMDLHLDVRNTQPPPHFFPFWWMKKESKLKRFQIDCLLNSGISLPGPMECGMAPESLWV